MFTPPALALAWVVAVDLAALGLGGFLLRRARLDAPEESRGERFGLALVTGLSALALGVFALCAARLWYAPLVLVLVAGLAVLGVREWGRLARERARVDAPAAWRDPGVFACVLLAALPFLQSFEPRLEHDALSYHLELPLVYARDHGFAAWPWNLYANMPHAFDLLFTLGYVQGGVTGANLIAFHGTALALVACFVAARRAGGRGFGGALGLLYLASPFTWRYASGTWNEPLLGAWLAWGFVLLQRWHARPGRRAFVAFALLVGFTAGAKHVALLWLAGLAVLAALALARSGGDARERRASAWAAWAALALLAAPWAVKAAVVTGDPIHPIGHAVFGGPGWSAIQQHQQHAFFARPVPFPPEADTARHLWAVPDLVLHPYRRFTEPVAPTLGVLWLGAPLVALAVAAWRRRRAGPDRRFAACLPRDGLAAWAWTASGLALFAATDLSSFGRYVAGFLAPIVLAAGLPFAPLVRGTFARALALGLALLACAIHAPVPRLRLEAFTRAGWERVAAETVAYRTSARIARELPPDARIFFVYENRTWPIPQRHDDDSVLQAPSSLRRLAPFADARAAAAWLRGEGFTHVVIDAGSEERVYTDARSYTLSDPELLPPSAMQREKDLVRAILRDEARRLFSEGSHEVYELRAP